MGSKSASTTPSIKTMILNASAKSITLLLAVGVASTAGSKNLRQRRTTLFGHGHDSKPVNHQVEASSVVTKQNLRGSDASPPDVDGDETIEAVRPPPASAEVEPAPEVAASSTATVEPSITLDKSSYSESEPITVTLNVGSPSHPYYSSPDAPSLNLDRTYSKWSVGIFMRDADPQGGTLSPIVSVDLCSALSRAGKDCNEMGRDWWSYENLSFTFDEEALAIMEGRWPLLVSDYGTGFDAYVLDGKGAGAIGPLEFYIQNDFDEVDASPDGPAHYGPSNSAVVGSSSSGNTAAAPMSHSTTKKTGLIKYNKGTKKSTERQHAIVSKSVVNPNPMMHSAKANTKIATGSGLEMMLESSSSSVQQETSSNSEQQGPSKSTITSDKPEYEADESVTVDFTIDAAQHPQLTKYKIGIFMRMAHPQGGALDPVVSLPLSLAESYNDRGVAAGSVTFSSQSMEDLLVGSWPIDLYQWGTGFDAYVLDGDGNDVVGPVKFNIMMDDTY